MIVWIVMRNGEIDEVFDTEQAAIHYLNSLVKRWNIVTISKRFVKSW